MGESHIRRVCAVIVSLVWWSWISIDGVLAEKLTIGTTINPGDIQLVVDDLGAVRFRSNDAGVVHDQWFWTGTDPSNGVIIAYNDGSAKKYRSRFFTAGTVVTPTFTPVVPDTPTLTPIASPTATAAPVTPTLGISSTPTSLPTAPEAEEGEHCGLTHAG